LLVQHLSNLSPYFHFGQLSVQRVALEITKHRKVSSTAVDTFLEEAVVRRELSDNFCFYEPNYDNVECAYGWARDTLREHEKDKREHLYSR
jgi:deoxyribodipyrimidine photo-lyase